MAARGRTASNAPRQFARALGWLGLGLGAIEMIAPGQIARALGMEGREPILQGYGLREIANGIGVLTSSDPRRLMWGRVMGDALDLATVLKRGDENDSLGGGPRRYTGAAVAALVGIAAMDVLCATMLERAEAPRRPRTRRDYSGRAGVPAHMRGAARNFEVPRDIRGPEALRSYSRT
jgi:hypothetical protein